MSLGAQADAGREEVARIPDRTGKREYRQMRGRSRVEGALDGLDAGHTGADEDRRHDCEARPSLRELGAQGERNPQRDGGEGIAEVVDQVREQRNAAAREEHGRLSHRCEAEYRKRKRDRMDACARALDALVYEPVGMPVVFVLVGGSWV